LAKLGSLELIFHHSSRRQGCTHVLEMRSATLLLT
jgi:hypothetical protein